MTRENFKRDNQSTRGALSERRLTRGHFRRENHLTREALLERLDNTGTILLTVLLLLLVNHCSRPSRVQYALYLFLSCLSGDRFILLFLLRVLFLLPVLIAGSYLSNLILYKYSLCLASVSFVLPLNTQVRLSERQLVDLILYDTDMLILILLLLLVNHHMLSNILYTLYLFLSCLIDKDRTVQIIRDARGREERYYQLLMQTILNCKIRDAEGKMQATGDK